MNDETKLAVSAFISRMIKKANGGASSHPPAKVPSPGAKTSVPAGKAPTTISDSLESNPKLDEAYKRVVTILRNAREANEAIEKAKDRMSKQTLLPTWHSVFTDDSIGDRAGRAAAALMAFHRLFGSRPLASTVDYLSNIAKYRTIMGQKLPAGAESISQMLVTDPEKVRARLSSLTEHGLVGVPWRPEFWDEITSKRPPEHRMERFMDWLTRFAGKEQPRPVSRYNVQQLKDIAAFEKLPEHLQYISNLQRLLERHQGDPSALTKALNAVFDSTNFTGMTVPVPRNRIRESITPYMLQSIISRNPQNVTIDIKQLKQQLGSLSKALAPALNRYAKSPKTTDDATRLISDIADWHYATYKPVSPDEAWKLDQLNKKIYENLTAVAGAKNVPGVAATADSLATIRARHKALLAARKLADILLFGGLTYGTVRGLTNLLSNYQLMQQIQLHQASEYQRQLNKLVADPDPHIRAVLEFLRNQDTLNSIGEN